MGHDDSFPDFYVIGAPKCGTTALFAFLSTHPGVFLPFDKEPNFFLPSTAECNLPRCRRRSDYLALFAGATEGQLTGEMSTTYLYYIGAVRRILDVRPDAKFVVAIRRPWEMAQSLHSQLYRTLIEDVKDFERAWRLQEVRRRGERIPRGCAMPEWLQYREVCALGKQLVRLYEIVPRSQVHVMVLDDFRAAPRHEYLKVLRFLHLCDDGRLNFPVVNANQVLRSRVAARLLLSARAVFGSAYYPVRRILNERLGLRPIHWLWRVNLKPARRPPLAEEFKKELVAEFLGEVEMLEALLDRRFPEWRQEADGREAKPSGLVTCAASPQPG